GHARQSSREAVPARAERCAVLPYRPPRPLPAHRLRCEIGEERARADHFLRRSGRGHTGHHLGTPHDTPDQARLADMYTVEAVPAGALGNASFLVADTDRGVGLVVDHLRELERYLT